MIRQYIKLIRVKHWIKNLLVLFPFIFSGQLSAWGEAVVAFFAFSLVASGVYVVNDLCDIDADRAHLTKCDRPLASGAISKRRGVVTAVMLLISSFAATLLAAAEPVMATAYLLLYVLLNIAYSLRLKHIPIVDVAIVAAGFLLRVLYGGAFCDIWISPWLFLTVLAFALYFALGKRRGELKKVGSNSRPSLAGYNQAFLDKMMYVFLACGLMYYSLWTIARAGDSSSVMLILGVPLAMIVCMRYSLIVESDVSDGDPVGVVFSDRLLLWLIAAWMVVVIVPLYI